MSSGSRCMLSPILLCFAVGCSETVEPGPESTPAPDQAAAAEEADVALRILDYEGIMNLIEGYQGRVVVVDVWSTSCVPCLKEFPGLVALHEKYGRNDVMCVSVSLDFEGLKGTSPQDDHERVLDYLRRFQATFDNILAGDDADMMYEKLALAAPPAVYVYDRSGKLAKRFDNEQVRGDGEGFTYKDVGRLVAQLAAETPPGVQEQ